jgi:hypothetical protein
MSMRRIGAILFACSLLMAGCGNSSGTGNGPSNSNGSSLPCTPGDNDCPAGQFCFNGLCAIGCQSNQDCASDQYCATDTDGLCHNKQVPTCDGDGDCEGRQVCTQGYCTAPSESEQQCDPNAISNDGCSDTAVCVERDGSPECVTLPRCSEDGTCPTGQAGAVCNDGYLPDKDKVCLLGACESSSNCPSDWSCVKQQNSVLGFCSSGGFGSPCTEDSQCESGSCSTFGPGTVGVCM